MNSILEWAQSKKQYYENENIWLGAWTWTACICKSTLCFTAFNLIAWDLNHAIFYKSNMTIRSRIRQGGIISKIRRRLTVQGESETIDGVLPSRPEAKEQTEDVEDVSPFEFIHYMTLCPFLCIVIS